MVSSDPISKATMNLEEDKMLFASLVTAEVNPRLSQGHSIPTRVCRRRKKNGKGDEEGGGDAKKRRLSDEQVKFLEMSFGEEEKLEFGRKVHLAAELGLHPKQVAVWFQNRRARHKSKQVEAAYLKLKAVLTLKDKLFEAQEEVRKMTLSKNGGICNSNGGEITGSPSSSTLSYQPLVGAVEEEEADFMYVQECELNNYIIEWADIDGM
ncbi:unnamed protein product [Musa textilis]